jgi:CysZ protein
MKIFFDDFLIGVKSWFSAIPFMWKHGLFVYFIFPIVVSILLGMGSLVLINSIAGYFMDFISHYFPHETLTGEGWWNQFLQILSDIGKYAMTFIVALFSWYLLNRFSKYLLLIFLSPVMAYVSEKTEKILTGHVYPFEWIQFGKDIVRGIALAIRNMVIEITLLSIIWFANIFLTLFFFPLGLIVSPVCILISFMISAYFLGFSALDYANERRKMSFRESVHSIRSMKGIAVGNGAVFSLLLLLPLLGVTIASVTSVVAATLALDKKGKLNN